MQISTLVSGSTYFTDQCKELKENIKRLGSIEAFRIMKENFRKRLEAKGLVFRENFGWIREDSSKMEMYNPDGTVKTYVEKRTFTKKEFEARVQHDESYKYVDIDGKERIFEYVVPVRPPRKGNIDVQVIQKLFE